MASKLPKLLADVASSALFDLDLTGGASALPSGWAVFGSGQTWSNKYGFNGNGTAYIRTDNFSARNALLAANKGYFYIEFERKAICTDHSYSFGSTFYDSDGHADTSVDKSLLWTDDGAGNDEIRMKRNAVNYQFVVIEESSTRFFASLNSRRSGKHDQRFGYLLFTWTGTSVALIIDGNVVKQWNRYASISSFKRVYIGAHAGSNNLGPYYVRRIMCGAEYIFPAIDPLKIAVIGDSFVVSGSDRSEPADIDSTTVSEIDGLQVSTEIGAAMFGKLDNYRGLSPFVFQVQANHFNRYGKFIPVYNAGNSGNGWRTDVGASYQIKAAYKDAAAAFNPRIIVMFGTVNDITELLDSFDVETAMKAHIDYMLSASPAIKRIYLVQPFGWYNASNTNANHANWLANYAAYVEQMTRIDGYKNKVVFVPHLWGADPYAEYLIGSHPDNATTSAGSDFHPSATGHTKMANIVTQCIEAEMLSMQKSSGLTFPLTSPLVSR